MLLNSQHLNPADPWRPSVDALAVVSQWKTFRTFVRVLNLWEVVQTEQEWMRCGVM